MQLVSLLKPSSKAYELLEDKSNWCQRATYLNGEGRACDAQAAQRCCIVGALALVYHDDRALNDAIFKVRQVVTKYTCQYLNLVDFNDNYSHDKILFALKEADV